MRGLWRLTWLEIKIFLREPLGVIGSVGIPVLVFVLMSRATAGARSAPARLPPFMTADLPVLAAILIATGREGRRGEGGGKREHGGCLAQRSQRTEIFCGSLSFVRSV
jgi:hypothetical protein